VERLQQWEPVGTSGRTRDRSRVLARAHAHQTCLLQPMPGPEAARGHLGHAGPYFLEPSAHFFNLELADTNSNDYSTAKLTELLQFAMTTP